MSYDPEIIKTVKEELQYALELLEHERVRAANEAVGRAKHEIEQLVAKAVNAHGH